jgi:hypothetical protein
MPHLVFNNRRWRTASDAFLLSSALTIFARLVWLILLITVTSFSFHSLLGCYDGWIILFYLLLSIFLFVLSIALEFKLIQTSLKGTMIESEERKLIPTILYLKHFLALLHFLCALFGIIIIAARSSIPCDGDFEQSRLNNAIVSIVAISQIIESFASVCCWYAVASHKINKHTSSNSIALIQQNNSSNNSNNNNNGIAFVNNNNNIEVEDDDDDEAWIKTIWSKRCKMLIKAIHCCSCNLFGGKNVTNEFDEVAEVLVEFFHHDGFLDVVFSDIIAGF